MVKKLLESDSYLFNYTIDHIKKGQGLLSSLTQAIEFLSLAGSCFSMLPIIPRSSLYIKAFSNKIVGTYITRDLSLAVQRANPKDLCKFLKLIIPQVDKEERDVLSRLLNQTRNYITKTGNHQDSGKISRDYQPKKFEAAKAAKIIELNRDKSTFEQDPIYSSVRHQVHTILEAFVAEKFFDPRNIFLSEVLIFDLKPPLREAFMPRPRFAIERALSVPDDYLNYTSSSAEKVTEKDETVIPLVV